MIAEYLSKNIGNRLGGSEGERKASEFIVKEFKKFGFEVEVQEFKFLGWRLTRNSEVEILEPMKKVAPSAPFLYSGSTPEDGVEGVIKKAGIMYIVPGLIEWPKYAIVSDNGKELAYLVAHPNGPPIPLPLTEPIFLSPHTIIGVETAKEFDSWISENRRIRVNMKIAGEYEVGLSSRNIIATLYGKEKPDEEVVICAHYDSALWSPGGNDNASGVEAMFYAAERLVDYGVSRTVKFIAFGSEEWNLLGSKYYVNYLKERGLLRKIKAVINLDMVGAGDTLNILVAPENFRDKIKDNAVKIVEDRGFKYNVSPAENIRGGSDHYPFHVEGIPAFFMFFWPYQYYHQKEDTADKLSDKAIKTAGEVAMEIVKILT